MVLEEVDPKLALELLLQDFGLDSTGDIGHDSDAALTLLACLVRRASGILGPSNEINLTRAVMEPLRQILSIDSEGYEELKEDLESVIESLTAIGDLREESTPRKQIYPGYPSFVQRRSGDVILLGVVPETINSVPASLTHLVSPRGILRHLKSETDLDLIRELGLFEITEEMWTQTPIDETPQEHVIRLREALHRSSQSPNSIEFLRFLNPTSLAPQNRTDYRRRWTNGIPPNITAEIAVARESDIGLWFVVQVEHGNVQRCLPLPASANARRGCDEAWRIQCALDAVKADREKRSRPIVRVQKDGQYRILKVYSPPLSWASRKWDLIGSKLTKEECVTFECLFGWRFTPTELDNEMPFLVDSLWQYVEIE